MLVINRCKTHIPRSAPPVQLLPSRRYMHSGKSDAAQEREEALRVERHRMFQALITSPLLPRVLH